ncbi:uncharacterized protein DC041_0011495 [Schistosoma bovis]|uniref:Uncharacterized protein n=1 Tax=Schistosoma bovis TaxID=6184 RepID=A0A430QAL3_SCHBO|nr:uncharacterized protein DC041_0011495 [Schistosoma bovis]
MKLSYKEILEKHSSDSGNEKLSRELQFQILLVLHTRFLCSFEEADMCADHELGDWISELISRLSLCDPTWNEWKNFLKLEVVDRYKTGFGRTLFHVYINLGLEPPECLPHDTELTSESRTLEENVDEVDGVIPNSPQSSNVMQPSPVPRNTLRQSLPRALFTDSVHISLSSSETPNPLTSTPILSNVISSCPVNIESSSKYRSCKTIPTPHLVLIPCQRSKRKCRTPTKRVPVKREARKKPTSTTPTTRHRHSSANSSKRTPASTSARTPKSSNRSRSHIITSPNANSVKPKSTLSETPISTRGESKRRANTDSKRNHRRSVHETPNPEKSYPRWERAKLAAAEKTKNKAIIVDESPIKPLLTTVSPLRRLRRANSMLNSLLYIEAQEAANITAQTHSGGGGGCLPTLLSNSSSLPFNSDDDNEDNNRLTRESSLQFSQELPIQYKDSCLSVAMSRAERWRRRQLEEEASLSQFSTQISNIQSNSVHINNDFINENINPSTPPRLLRRNSNLLANMISSSDHHRLNTALSQLIHSPKRIKTPRKNIFNVTPKCTPNAKNNCSQLSTTTTQINTDCLNPAQVTTTPPISTMKPFLQNDVQSMSSLNTVGSFPRSTPRRRTYKSKDTDDSHPITTTTTTTSRRRTRHSSGFVQSNTRETIVSPQIFDEEAMFLGREEFLNETTPNVSSTFDKCVEDDDDGAEFGALLMSRKRRKISPVCTPTQPPVFRLNTLAAATTTAGSTNTHQVFTGSPNSHDLTGNHTPYSFGSNNFMDDYLINAPKRNINCISDGSVNTVANSNSSDYGTSDTTISTTVNTTSANTISISDQKQSDVINNSKASIFTTCPVVKPVHQSTFAPLHVFNRPSIAVSDSIDNTTTIHSSQSNSTCIALRKQLFGGIDEPSNSISNPKLSEDIHENLENIPPNHLNSPTSSLSLSSSPSSSKSHIIPLSYDNPNHNNNNNSRHLWDENSLDIPLSPVLHQLQYNIQSSIDTNYHHHHHSYTYLSKNNHNLFPSKFIVPIIQQSTLHNPSCHRGLHPRRNLFQ